jgi:raffinose/stachyose/melibiose transport system permease protein
MANSNVNALNYKFDIKAFLIYFIAGIASILFIYPLIYTLFASLKTNLDIFTNYFAPPLVPHFENYSNALIKGRIGQCFLNSAFVVTMYVVLGLLFSTLASFIFARIKAKALTFLYTFIIAGMMISVNSILVPLAQMSVLFKLSNSYSFLISIYLAGGMPFMIFVITGYMKSLPRELEEAAIMDGASLWYIYKNIAIPLSRPVIATMGILAFITGWNDMIQALIFIKKSSMWTIALGLLNFSGFYTVDFAGLCAAIIIANVPTILIYLFLQEYVEKGLTAGAVKG